MGNWELGMGHGASGIGHRAWGIVSSYPERSRRAFFLLPSSFFLLPSSFFYISGFKARSIRAKTACSGVISPFSKR
ncbi:MAG: hypothetical protein QQW96_01715 [Tychonema bourrellyi B0820]|nr:hypothetical protein [Tychonema bourrellyi B0820]